ncbi:MAG: ATP-binding protein [Flavobacteriaceae bacterium]|nr:ATP-binding protein [Flavobacteriaceae bacterium]
MPENSTNLKHRVNKLHLPWTKSLYPLYETISNSIHAIDEEKRNNPNLSGTIEIKLIRNGLDITLSKLNDVNVYPIDSFEVMDNGIGLNEDNYNSFQEFDSEYKLEIGGKGIGRFICLKVVSKMQINSIFADNGKFRFRNFGYKKTKEGFENYEEGVSDEKVSKTKVCLIGFNEKFKKNIPKSITELGRRIITHFQLYFLQKKEPEIILINQNNQKVNLTELYSKEFKSGIEKDDLTIGNMSFDIFIARSYEAKSHKIHYCAHDRTVKEEGLSKYIPDLKDPVKESEDDQGYYFQVIVVGEYLNKHVNEERKGFNFQSDKDADEELDADEITLSHIREKSIRCTEKILNEILTKKRKEKLEVYKPMIQKYYQNYNVVFNHNKESVEKLPAGLSKEELDLHLYEIESKWRYNVKEKGLDLLEKKKDITTIEDYKILYDKFLTEFNSVGQSDLSRYVIHRRSVIDLLEKLIELDDNRKITNEDIIHSLFFPMRETDDSITNEKQNLWLIDERLNFNTFLTSDKSFKQVPELNSQSTERTDLLIQKDETFRNAVLYSEDYKPYQSFTIVEFKKPDRNDYILGDKERDPLRQVKRYIREIIKGKVKKKGRKIEATEKTPFYCYIVADLTSKLIEIIEDDGYIKTPDGSGYFRFYDAERYKYNAYVEVLPFDKIISDAKQRNKVLFDKLNIPI